LSEEEKSEALQVLSEERPSNSFVGLLKGNPSDNRCSLRSNNRHNACSSEPER
jgi:hypothetical protein